MINRLCYLIHKRNLANAKRKQTLHAIYRLENIYSIKSIKTKNHLILKTLKELIQVPLDSQQLPLNIGVKYIFLQMQKMQKICKEKASYKKEIKVLCKNLGYMCVYDTNGFTKALITKENCNKYIAMRESLAVYYKTMVTFTDKYNQYMTDVEFEKVFLETK